MDNTSFIAKKLLEDMIREKKSYHIQNVTAALYWGKKTDYNYQQQMNNLDEIQNLELIQALIYQQEKEIKELKEAAAAPKELDEKSKKAIENEIQEIFKSTFSGK